MRMFLFSPLVILAFLFNLLVNPGEAIPKEREKGEPSSSPSSPETNALGLEKEKGLGSEEIKRPDGEKDRVYYSITTPEEEKELRKEEKEKQDKSLEILNNIIIDKRARPRHP